MENIKRCKKCNLPSNYPRISLDEEGVCNFCKIPKAEIDYLGVDKLKEDINEILKNYPDRKYDCVVALSGGRDSSYLVYLAKKVLNLNVLAVSLNHKYIPKQTMDNIVNLTKNLGVELKIIDSDRLNKYSRTSVRTWAKKPDSAMLVTFCTGCRYGIKCTIKKFVEDNNIPILLMGDTPYEDIPYRLELLTNGNETTKKNLVKGYLKQLVKNPRYAFHVKTLYNQYLDFKASKDQYVNENIGLRVIRPFGAYIDWQKCDVINTIKKYGWKHDTSLNSTWRSDCYVNLIRQYYYKKMLGFNDLDVYYAKLIKYGLISKEEALEKIKTEGKYDDAIIRDILKEYYGLSLDKINKKIEKQTTE